MSTDRYAPHRARDIDYMVSKAVHHFDPEGDRQRRIGFITGAGLASAGVGGMMMRGKPEDERLVSRAGERAFKVDFKNARKNRLGLALMLGGAGLGVGGYKYGTSQRNGRYR